LRAEQNVQDTGRPRRDGLGLHEATVARDLAMLGLPAANWPDAVAGPDGRPALDVLVVGAGMNGVAAAGALQFKGVRNILVLDRARPGQEGPWRSFARMDTLRSPKQLPGPALGVPSLTFRAWYEARSGLAAWETLYKIANGDWADYLLWLQRMLGLPVRHGAALDRLEPAGRFVAAHVAANGARSTLYARRVVLATGRGGAGGALWPAFVDPALAPDLALHSNDEIDFARLAGKRVAVIGGGASAWDNAATALERGAERVDMYVRRRQLPQINKGRGSAFPGFLEGWASLPDAQRWELMVYLNDLQAPVPHETVHRTLRQPGFHIHLGARTEAVRREGARVAVAIAGEAAPRLHDIVIVGTGFDVDVRRIPELAAYAEDIATWGDRLGPPPELVREDLARFPYLGPGFELAPKQAGADPTLGRIHLVNYGAHMSHAGIASDIPGVNIAGQRAASAIVAALFAEDIDAMRRKIEAFDEPELLGTPFYVPPEQRGVS
jgi:cation diffusion facilitator CzcD-associated flavoprotein CzcO